MSITLVSPSVDATNAAFMACIPHMRAFARILTGDAFGADDLVEAALRRALSEPTPTLQAGGMRRWMFTLLHVLHYGSRRETRVMAPPDGAVSREPNGSVADFACAFWKLRDDQREILLLEAAAGLSRADVAAIYGAPPGMVDLRASMAQQSLRAALHAAAERACATAAVMDYARVPVAVCCAANRA